jgi:autophagy-related protein 2
VTERVKLRNSNLTLYLYEGYDLSSTRQAIERGIKDTKKRPAKIRQLVAEGQTYDPTLEEPNTLLFNSIYVGLQEDTEGMEPDVLIAAIDNELREDTELETATQSSWQSLKPQQTSRRATQPSREGKSRRLTRASAPSIEFKLQGMNIEYDKFASNEDLSSRIFTTIRDAEILDHVKTSTWRKFLTALRSDSKGNIRETGSNMIRIELQSVRPVAGHPSEEARLRVRSIGSH